MVLLLVLQLVVADYHRQTDHHDGREHHHLSDGHVAGRGRGWGNLHKIDICNQSPIPVELQLRQKQKFNFFEKLNFWRQMSPMSLINVTIAPIWPDGNEEP